MPNAPYQYNPTGALNGLFAPAYIAGNPEATAAAAAWNAANLKTPPPAVAPPSGGYGAVSGGNDPRSRIAALLAQRGAGRGIPMRRF